MNILLANLTKMVEDSGGLAKVTCLLAQELHKRGNRVTIVYSDEKEGKFFYPVNHAIPTYDVRHYKGSSITFPWYYKVKRELLRTVSKKKARVNCK